MKNESILSPIQKVVTTLVALTMVIVGVYYLFGAEKSLYLDPALYDYEVVDDRFHEGSSTSEFVAEDDGARISCELKESEYPWPYCSLSLFLSSDRTKGLDLSRYHTVYLDLDYINEDPAARLRLYMRNFNPAYSSEENAYTVKYNGLEYTPGTGQGEIAIPLDNFQVMTWWLADLNIPIQHAGPERSNVIAFELATGSGAKVGKHEIVIKSIRLEGSYVDGEKLLLGLLFFWLLLGVSYVVAENHQVREQARQAQLRHQHLQSVNKKLRLENTQFAQMAERDALTGARNRHNVRDWLAEQTRLCRSRKQPLSVIYLDIDFFKHVNDTFGHTVGDDILKEFVLIVSSAIEESDHLVRWGGEEFIVFCPGINLEGASEKAQRIVLQVRRHIWMHGETLTCSAGVSEMGSERTTETIARADEALYAAKQNGRDRVEISPGREA